VRGRQRPDLRPSAGLVPRPRLAIQPQLAWRVRPSAPGRLLPVIAWQNLVPDQTHMVVTAGYGTAVVGGSFKSDTYVPLTPSADGMLAMAYFAQGNAMSLTINSPSSPAQ
jgi:hypothetical protein